MPSTDKSISTLVSLNEISPELDSFDSLTLIKPDRYHPTYIEHIQQTFTYSYYLPELSTDELTELVDKYNGTALGLINFDIEDKEVFAIAHRLPQLTTLLLNNNNVGPNGARAIANNLHNLTELNLDGNDIRATGTRAILNNLTNLHDIDLYRRGLPIYESPFVEAPSSSSKQDSQRPRPARDNAVPTDKARRSEREASIQKLRALSRSFIDTSIPTLTSLDEIRKLDTVDLAFLRPGRDFTEKVRREFTHCFYISDDFSTAELLRAGNNRIRKLAVDNNQIRADGAQAIVENFPDLTHLYLGSNNQVGDDGATVIANGLPQLTTLSIEDHSRIRTKGAIAIANGLPQLTTLSLEGSNVRDQGAVAIATGLPQLVTLNLSVHNGIGAVGATAIAENLTNLNLERNRIRDEGAIAIANGLPQLTALNLHLNILKIDGVRSLAGNLHNLTQLCLGENWCGDGDTFGDEGAIAIANGLPQLTTLDLIDDTGDSGAQAIASNLHNLTHLDLHYSLSGSDGVGDKGAAAIADNLRNLTHLRIHSDSLGDDGVIAIANGLPHLDTLLLFSCNFGDAGARAIADNLHNLTDLYLGHNRYGSDGVGDEGATAIANRLPQLTELTLGRNVGPTGTAAILNNLDNLTYLKLNNLTEISDFDSLL